MGKKGKNRVNIRKNRKKVLKIVLTDRYLIGYTNLSQGHSDPVEDYSRRSKQNVKNVSAEKITKKKRTRLYEENGDQKRKKSFSRKKSERKKSTFPLKRRPPSGGLSLF